MQVQKVLPSVVKVKIQRSEGSEEESELISFEGGGTGFLFDSAHHIITNAHVIKHAKKIVVIDQQHTEYPATLVGKDETTDIALLDVPGFDAPPLMYAKTTNPLPGELVFVIGSPFSLGHSVSAGIISTTGRFLSNYPYLPFIQTDASINPGNSGGPLCNQSGEVIGMVSTYYSKQGNYTNIGFAITSDDMLRIGQRLLNEKNINRGYLGAELLFSEKISRKIGYNNGVLITRIDPNSPAFLAGLKPGDLIVKINSRPFLDGGELYRSLEQSSPGDEIILSLIRQKELYNLPITLGTAAEEKNVQTNSGKQDATEKLGMILREESNVLRVISSFAVAYAMGIEPNDIILELNGVSVRSIRELNLQLSKLKENEIAFITLRKGNDTITLPLATGTALKTKTFHN